MNSYNNQIRLTIFIFLFVLLISIGAFIAIPVGPVPIVLQNMFVFMAGLILGKRWGALCIVIYLAAGAAGLPIFSGGSSGIDHILGPTGGYLLSYIPTVFVVGWISEKSGESSDESSFQMILTDLKAMFVGSIIIYLFGVPWLKEVLNLSWEKSLTLGLLPFIPGDMLKIITAAYLVKLVRRYTNKNRV